MDIICPLDVQFADQIAALLAPPSPQALQDYFNQLIATRRYDGLKIKQCGEFGKGVYADLEFKEGELILKDQMLVGAQHVSNKVESLVCSYCFCYIGSIELQIGRKLYLQGLGEDFNMGVDRQALAHTSREVCPINLLGKGEGNTDHDNLRSFTSSESKDNILPPKEIIESLINGELSLPYSKHFPLPPIISCAGGCGEQYCSKSCAEADWESFHSLLCTGGSSGSTRMEALARFMEHANETNDIFLLAAKAISSTILKYEKLKAASLEQQTQPNTMEHFNFYLLLEAWKPLSMGFKKRWWDCVAVPTDIDHHEEATFRAQIKELAFTSLQLLKEAIFIKDCAPLFSLEIYGHIIGMFELNNLDLVVASPVEDYFIYIDDLPCPEKEEAEKSTRPFLKALGDDYSVCCQGTAFFPLQSCMNHSCCPNAKAFKRDEDRDGQATIIALGPISKGEEITISYIDEDLPYEERQALLEDYGFRCKCPKCVEEEA